jgi:glutamate synthase (NADPH/NADH) small chain
MRASRKDISAARDEGVAFMFYMRPKEFVGGESLNGVIYTSESQQPGDILVCDAAIVAFGRQADSNNWLLQLGIATDERGFICADEYGRTVNPRVFVGEDNTHGPDLVVTGVTAGRRAGPSIQAALQ